MKKFVSKLILSITLAFLFVLLNSNVSFAASKITIDESINYNSTDTFIFSSSKVYDKYEIEYLM